MAVVAKEDEDRRRRPLRVAKRALDAALDAVPGAVVERVTSASAPLTRYSGRTSAGAAALASALALLAQPPRARRRRATKYTLAEIAGHIDEPNAVVERWAGEGLLGEHDADGCWSREALDRATLLAFAHDHGTSDDELEAAAHDGRLPLVVLEHVLSGETPLSANDVARRAGVPLDLALRIWRALGFPIDSPDDPLFARGEISALRVLAAMRSVFTEDDLVEAASVVGRAMAEVSAASTELFRRRLTAPYLEAGASELETSLRLAAVTDLLVPTLGPMLEVVLRRHLAVAARAEAALQIEQTGDAAASQRQLTVCFADLVGFTSASEKLTPLEVGMLASRLLRCAEQTVVPQGGRIVKSIGDAVMFTARDPLSGARMALGLIDAAAAAELPPVRAGAAHGPVLRAYADFFGRTVNIAARLCDVATAGEVLVYSPEVDDAALQAGGLQVHRGRPRKLRGIDGALPVLHVQHQR